MRRKTRRRRRGKDDEAWGVVRFQLLQQQPWEKDQTKNLWSAFIYKSISSADHKQHVPYRVFIVAVVVEGFAPATSSFALSFAPKESFALGKSVLFVMWQLALSFCLSLSFLACLSPPPSPPKKKNTNKNKEGGQKQRGQNINKAQNKRAKQRQKICVGRHDRNNRARDALKIKHREQTFSLALLWSCHVFLFICLWGHACEVCFLTSMPKSCCCSFDKNSNGKKKEIMRQRKKEKKVGITNNYDNNKQQQ